MIGMVTVSFPFSVLLPGRKVGDLSLSRLSGPAHATIARLLLNRTHTILALHYLIETNFLRNIRGSFSDVRCNSKCRKIHTSTSADFCKNIFTPQGDAVHMWELMHYLTRIRPQPPSTGCTRASGPSPPSSASTLLMTDPPSLFMSPSPHYHHHQQFMHHHPHPHLPLSEFSPPPPSALSPYYRASSSYLAKNPWPAHRLGSTKLRPLHYREPTLPT